MNTPQHPKLMSPLIPSALPEAWIERIFSVMAGYYGSKFADLWSGTDPEVMRRVWAEKLAGFRDHPEVFKAALDACDDRLFPPTLPEFIGMCRTAASSSRRPAEALALPEPKADPERAKSIAKYAVAAIRKGENHDFLAWCKDLRHAYLTGEHLLPIQIRNASEALNEVWANGQCTAKDVE